MSCSETYPQGTPIHRGHLSTGDTYPQGTPIHRRHLSTGHLNLPEKRVPGDKEVKFMFLSGLEPMTPSDQKSSMLPLDYCTRLTILRKCPLVRECPLCGVSLKTVSTVAVKLIGLCEAQNCDHNLNVLTVCDMNDRSTCDILVCCFCRLNLIQRMNLLIFIQ